MTAIKFSLTVGEKVRLLGIGVQAQAATSINSLNRAHLHETPHAQIANCLGRIHLGR